MFPHSFQAVVARVVSACVFTLMLIAATVLPMQRAAAQTPELDQLRMRGLEGGRVNLERKNNVLAMAFLSQALLADPTNGEARYLRGLAFMRNGQTDRAVRDLNAATRTPYIQQHPEIWETVGDLERIEGNGALAVNAAAGTLRGARRTLIVPIGRKSI